METSDHGQGELEGELREVERDVDADRARLAADERHVRHVEDELARTELYVIHVNGREKQVEVGELSFDQIVRLAFDPLPTGPNVVYTITYRRGPAPKPEGSIAPGQTVAIKSGEIFNVTCTDRS